MGELASRAGGRPRTQLRKYIADHYLARIEGLSPNAKHRYKSQLKMHVLPHLGSYQLDRIDEPRVQAFVSELLKGKLAPSSAASCARLLLRVLTVADGQGFATARVDARRIQWPRTQSAPRESRCFSAQEVETILASATGWPRVMFCLMAWAGLRIGEALGLDWSHVDWTGCLLRLRQQASRGQLRVLKSYTSMADLPMDPRLQSVLADFWRQAGSPAHGLLFSRHGEPRRAQGVTACYLTPLLRRLGIAHAGLHAFRHSFCRSLWAAGADAASVMRLMRHSNLNQTLKYTHVGAQALRQTIDRVSMGGNGVSNVSPAAAPRTFEVTQPGKPT
jgi:integrase/recombinase XerD